MFNLILRKHAIRVVSRYTIFGLRQYIENHIAVIYTEYIARWLKRKSFDQGFLGGYLEHHSSKIKDSKTSLESPPYFVCLRIAQHVTKKNTDPKECRIAFISAICRDEKFPKNSLTESFMGPKQNVQPYYFFTENVSLAKTFKR